MIRPEPKAAELLWLARKQLLDECLPELPQGKRYEILLIGAAMAVAAREMEAGDRPMLEATAGLRELYGVQPAHSDERSLRQSEFPGLLDRLARDIRGGSVDGSERVYTLLRTATMALVRESNPGLLRD